MISTISADLERALSIPRIFIFSCSQRLRLFAAWLRWEFLRRDASLRLTLVPYRSVSSDHPAVSQRASTSAGAERHGRATAEANRSADFHCAESERKDRAKQNDTATGRSSSLACRLYVELLQR